MERERPVFACVVEPDRHTVTVQAIGELDVATAPILETVVADLRDAGFAQVIVDLRQVTFMACAAVNVLTTQDAALLAAGGRMRLIRPAVDVDRIFDLAGARSRLSFLEEPRTG
jgi:anti-anti-sigma factor